jgi:hypothetical protein
VKFRAGELEFNASVVEANQATSPQTGDPLQSLIIQFRAQKAVMHEQALVEAQQRQAGGVFSLTEGGEPELEWRVLESRSTFVGTEPWGVNHHVWRIEQVERLAIELLMIDSVELEPYDYAEEVAEDGTVRLAARALISEPDLEALSRIDGPVEVVRGGISDSPREMRLSGYIWSERADSLVVAVACEDARQPRVTLAGFVGAHDDELSDIVALGGIDAEELRRRRHARRYVKDIDGWPLQK